MRRQDEKQEQIPGCLRAKLREKRSYLEAKIESDNQITTQKQASTRVLLHNNRKTQQCDLCVTSHLFTVKGISSFSLFLISSRFVILKTHKVLTSSDSKTWQIILYCFFVSGAPGVVSMQSWEAVRGMRRLAIRTTMFPISAM